MKEQENLAEKANILLVDDRADSLLVLQAVLNFPQYNLITAQSGAEAISKLAHYDFALIVLDVQMPGMDGFETARAIKQDERYRTIPVIFVTAINKEPGYITQGYEAGAVDYIFKPFDPHILQSKVSVLTALYFQRRQIEYQALELREKERRNRQLLLAELELESIRRYGNLADAVPHLILKMNSQGVADYFNRAWLDYTGLSADQSSGWGWQNMFHPEDLSRVLELCIRANDQSEAAPTEVRIRGSHTNDFKWYILRVVEERRKTGAGYCIVTATDIHDRKLMEGRLRVTEESSRFLAKAGAALATSLEPSKVLDKVIELSVEQFGGLCGIYSMNAEGIVEQRAKGSSPSTTGLLRLLDLSAYAGKNMGPLKVLQTGEPDFLPVLQLHSEKLNLSPEESQYLETASPLSLMCFPLFARGKNFGVITFISPAAAASSQFEWRLATDSTRLFSFALDNADLYQQAQNAIKSRDEFLSIASHELKTPLTSLKLQLEVSLRKLGALSSEVLASKFSRSLEVSFRQVERLGRLIENLLDVSMIQSGRLKFHMEETPLNQLILDLVDRLQEYFSQSGCLLALELDEETVGHWDKSKIEQVILNLLSNCFKYAPGKPVKIQTHSQNGEAVLIVEDSGPGISLEKQAKIFERFERASSDDISGLGLGLYIAKQIVSGHGGHLSLQSQEGQGSKFIIRLPVRIDEEVLKAG